MAGRSCHHPASASKTGHHTLRNHREDHQTTLSKAIRPNIVEDEHWRARQPMPSPSTIHQILT
ncbi:hypothetical protein B1C73_10825 [Cutibacterium acnes subsp. acnes]|nr:hypothetical protein B1C73_10825 [Cutibacterium acnes subsp. acnes]